jgi:hypothetical protein
MIDPLSAHRQIDAQPDPGSAIDLVHLFVLRLKGGEPADGHMPGRCEDMGAMTWMLLVIPAKLVVSGASRLLGDEPGPKAAKRIGEGNRGLEDPKTEISRTYHPLPVPIDHPIGVRIGLGQQAVSPDETRHRVTVFGALWGVHPEMGGLGHPLILAWLGPKFICPTKDRETGGPCQGRPGKIGHGVRTPHREWRTGLGRIR